LEEDDFSRWSRSRIGFIFQNSDVQLYCPTVADELAFGPLQIVLFVVALNSFDWILDITTSAEDRFTSGTSQPREPHRQLLGPLGTEPDDDL
jgi:hypothetical protein